MSRTRYATDAAVAAAAAVTAAAVTDNSGGTSSATIAVIGATYSQTEVANAVASLATIANANLADVAAIKTELAAIRTKLGF